MTQPFRYRLDLCRCCKVRDENIHGWGTTPKYPKIVWFMG